MIEIVKKIKPTECHLAINQYKMYSDEFGMIPFDYKHGLKEYVNALPELVKYLEQEYKYT